MEGSTDGFKPYTRLHGEGNFTDDLPGVGRHQGGAYDLIRPLIDRSSTTPLHL